MRHVLDWLHAASGGSPAEVEREDGSQQVVGATGADGGQMGRRAVVFGGALAVLPLQARSQVDPTLIRIEALAEAARAEMRAPGLVLGVVRDGRVVIRRGFGVRGLDAAAAATAQTRFQVAAVLRPLIAMRIGQLIDLGRVRFGDEIADILPTLAISDARGRGITIDHLLTHSSGLPADGPVPIAGAQDIELAFAPGQGFMPSKLGLRLLVKAIEKLDGVPFEQTIKEHVLVPLGMRGTTFAPGEVGQDLGRPHTIDPNGAVLPSSAILDDRDGAGGPPLYSNVDDMLRFVEASLADGAIDGRQVLSKDLARDLRQPRPISITTRGFPPGIMSAPAWYVLPHGSHEFVVQGSGSSQYSSLCLFSPKERFGVFVAANIGQAPGRDSLRAFALNVIDEGLLSVPDKTSPSSGSSAAARRGPVPSSRLRSAAQ